MAVTVTISRALLDAIRAHADEEPEREVCGLLLGCAGRIEEVRRTANLAENPRDSFEIDPAALFAAIRDERAGGSALHGHYHSHPRGRCAPSARDARMALDMGKLWLIVAGDEIGLWVAAGSGRLGRETLVIE